MSTERFLAGPDAFTAITGLTDSTDYTIENVGGNLVFLIEKATAPLDTDAKHILQVGGAPQSRIVVRKNASVNLYVKALGFQTALAITESV